MKGLNYGELAAMAETAYVYLDKLKEIDRDYHVAGDLELAIKINDVDDTFNGKFSVKQAADFVSRWSAADHRPNTESGFSSTLFYNKTTDQYVLSFRGTEVGPLLDGQDLAADLDIALDGIAIDQVVDMYNEYQRLSSARNTAYEVATLTRLDAETTGYGRALAIWQAQNRYGLGGAAGTFDFLKGRNDIIVDSGVVYAVERQSSTDEVRSKRADFALKIKKGSRRSPFKTTR